MTTIDYAEFTSQLHALVERLSQALREKDFDEAQTLLGQIRHSVTGVEIWLNVQNTDALHK